MVNTIDNHSGSLRVIGTFIEIIICIAIYRTLIQQLAYHPRSTGLDCSASSAALHKISSRGTPSYKFAAARALLSGSHSASRSIFAHNLHACAEDVTILICGCGSL